MENITLPKKAPNCLKCVHFKVSWDTDHPRSCTLYGFKCSQMPSRHIYELNGAHCYSFKQKEGLK